MMTDMIWCEKYRPRRLQDLVGNRSIIEALLAYSKYRNVPNMLMTGPPGCGKTSAVQSLASQCTLGNSEYLELNTSDERGVDTVRNRLKLFSGKKIPENCLRIVFLDEADGMTHQAQLGLKALMDTYTGKVTFVLSCNKITCIHESLVSRCAVFQFEPIPIEVMCQKMEEIVSDEKVKTSRLSIKAIAEMAPGDLRSAINALQMISMKDRLDPLSELSNVEVRDSELTQLLCKKRISSNGKDFRDAIKVRLQTRSRCEDRYGVDLLLQHFKSEQSAVDPLVIRETIKLLFGKGISKSLSLDPILSVARMFAVLRSN